jgi:hypothetical protein
MSKKEHISDEELKREAPLLFSLERKQIEAPEGYFDELPDKVMTSLDAPIRQMPKRSSSIGSLWKVAAGIALLIGMYFLLSPVEQPLGNELSAQELHINVEQDMDYLLEIEDDILYDLLAEQSPLLEEDEIDERIEFLMDEEIELEDIVDSL